MAKKSRFQPVKRGDYWGCFDTEKKEFLFSEFFKSKDILMGLVRQMRRLEKENKGGVA